MAETIPDPAHDRRSWSRWRWAKWLLSAGVIVALVVVVVRVTGDDAGDPLPPSHEPPADGEAIGAGYSEEQAFEFAACMREQGIDFPDPEVGADGQVTMSPGPGVDTNGSAFQDAAAACETQVASTGGPTSTSAASPAPGGTFSAEQMADFAECMRKQGIDFPDPQVGDDGQVEMSPGPGVDTNSSAFQEARAACQAELAPTIGQPSGGDRG
jgi:hypothetical protein